MVEREGRIRNPRRLLVPRGGTDVVFVKIKNLRDVEYCNITLGFAK